MPGDCAWDAHFGSLFLVSLEVLIPGRGLSQTPDARLSLRPFRRNWDVNTGVTISRIHGNWKQKALSLHATHSYRKVKNAFEEKQMSGYLEEMNFDLKDQSRVDCIPKYIYTLDLPQRY
jgi:hypothetical protein